MRAAVQMVALSALVAATAGCSTNAKEASQQMTVVPVKTVNAQQGMIGTGKVYTGSVMPLQTVKVVPKTAGKIEQMAVDVGTPVKQGQLLFKLEDKDLRNTLEKANAAVAAAQAGVGAAQAAQESGVVQATSGVVQSKNGMIQAKNGMVQAQGAITQAQSGLEQAQNAVTDAENGLKKAKQSLTDATTQLNRTKQLYESGATSKAQLEQAQTALVTAQTGYNSAEIARKGAVERLSAAKKNVSVAQKSYANANATYENSTSGYSNAQKQVGVASGTAGIQASEQGVRQAQVAAQIATDALRDAAVTSPIDGIVAVKNNEVGELVSPQAPNPVLVVTNLNTVNVLFYASSADLANLHLGMKMNVKVDAMKVSAIGTVKSVSPVDEKGKGYPVQVSVPNPGLKLRAGLVTELTAIAEGSKPGIVVPSSALVKEQNKAYVYVVNGDRAKRKEVQIGEEKSGNTLITGGLNANDAVITDNVVLLSDNAKIQVQQE
ncbi:RND family efflux transporter MFP subunit [Aneurinibacillus soli]|uniref:Putative efflux system component YknX n=2 Tax=Aneurinibacillus soli TaxID=1500254 RepID=A0A0U5C4A7_9BACL|nr:efflux RND transporter periplasmic adaptor subunit [Aneurinibacillus soli]PYE61514.1 RND family efflux transporter MFP subunit [Aneurinibacillus soli]BAU26531.1 putative efflux system component YknX [Aneurinibacillus soli]